ncbi:MAG: amidohydrolase family protein [Ancrocorticia sp.]|jgi:imidazolonepropionase-like amidohydrolase|nr:amidohydrolase family protein [Ancrocorticia sp.]MCI1895411.1 amidohydrolase family protein [Ancrocorticia sp.]MCI1932978.1 amidohydrolase family protein [Ancrocorticia sp.]MCI1963343.1 amidohydrolase family protein [Ancrocorticia sp.]MCI2002808.1 amidohydrolase family protein [Ancrocorticia sp.]
MYHLSGVLRGTSHSEAWVVDGRVTFIPPAQKTTEVHGYVYPGLVDAHTHPGLSHKNEPVTDGEIRRRLEACRAQGVTHIREMGAQRDVAPVLRDGLPSVIRAGRHIARPMRYLRYLAVEIEPRDLPAEVVRQVERGDGWVKIVGDWIDRSDGADSDLRPLWPPEVLRDAVAAVHAAGGKVAVHTFARETIDSLLDAGVDSIEHGTGMTRDQMIEARNRGVLIDPTVRQIRTFPTIAARAGKYPRYRARMLAMNATRREHLAEFVAVGSNLVMGSDTAEDVAEGGLATELMCAAADGIPTSTIMAAASSAGRQLLGLPSWDEGAPADLVVYAKDPEADIAQVMHPAAVFLAGKRFPE